MFYLNHLFKAPKIKVLQVYCVTLCELYSLIQIVTKF